MMKDARPDGILGTMTTIAADEAPVADSPEPDLDAGKVRCECGAIVEPTKKGGHRPRPHLNPNTRVKCRIQHPAETLCKRCGGKPHEPQLTPAGKVCRSAMFHPETWMAEVNGRRVRVGNAAAAGELAGNISGEYFGYIRRRYPGRSDSPSRAPFPAGYDLQRRCSFWILDEVRKFERGRPGKNRPE
jgi:hypothetical protein